MFEIEEIKEIIYNAGVDGHLGKFQNVQKWLDTMTKLEEDILLLVANEAWQNSKNYDEEDPTNWGE